MPVLNIYDLEAIFVFCLEVDLKHRADHIKPIGSPLEFFPLLNLFQALDIQLKRKKMLSKKL